MQCNKKVLVWCLSHGRTSDAWLWPDHKAVRLQTFSITDASSLCCTECARTLSPGTSLPPHMSPSMSLKASFTALMRPVSSHTHSLARVPPIRQDTWRSGLVL